ncbi:conserved hypothetical protein [Talaromyces stipitatus ATCC 10500]|uniref:Uncharacterized protein n=1 Tax=Talaromyces stipitatus (strain ATCC 10500 / CBS 375.48 / QM 6759 / NRRL 1006) TaxID=441959 RepID=B8MAS4_TALSN|nr:uncharacterized protein TSTA_115590 [Talaromyces stipitatus ATCC 10500]EED17764.1 conserved hypothetical protein [Talaromyces stipitatus ATCC 10500]
MSAITLSITPAMPRQTLFPVTRSNRRTLQRTKLSALNKLNGSVGSTPLKRTISFDSDGENVKPCIKSEPTKRKRSVGDEGQLSESPKTKASRTEPTIWVGEEKVSSPLPKGLDSLVPVDRDFKTKPKSAKAFGRRSKLAPLFHESVRRNAANVSKKSIEPLRKPVPASWNFDIHVDTEVEEATNLMEHSAYRLDISDGEGKTLFDDRDKENIPPHELGISLPTTAQPVSMASRKNMMAQYRTPLSELEVADYYSEGLHALSCEVIQEDTYIKGPSTQVRMALNTPDRLQPFSVWQSTQARRQSKDIPVQEISASA